MDLCFGVIGLVANDAFGCGVVKKIKKNCLGERSLWVLWSKQSLWVLWKIDSLWVLVSEEKRPLGASARAFGCSGLQNCCNSGSIQGGVEEH